MDRPYRDDEMVRVANIREYIKFFDHAVAEGHLEYARFVWERLGELCDELGEMIAREDENGQG